MPKEGVSRRKRASGGRINADAFTPLRSVNRVDTFRVAGSVAINKYLAFALAKHAAPSEP